MLYKKNKYLFSIIVLFSFLILSNSCFGKAASNGDKVYFQKPDSWTGDKIYANLIKSVDGSTLTATPGIELTKKLSKFKLDDLYELKGDLYSFYVPNEIEAGFDKIVFSNGNDTTLNSTIETDFSNNSLYIVNGGSGTAQTTTISSAFNITLSTKLQRFALMLNTENPNSEIKNNLTTIATNVQLALANLDSYDLYENVINPLSDINTILQKDSTSIDNLKDKIDEGKSTIKDGGYTTDTTQKLESDITNAQNMVENNEYFTNIQIIDITTTIDKDIQNLIVDTLEFEKILKDAKNIDTTIYTDETIKILENAISKSDEYLINKNSLTVSKVNELIKSLKDSISGLKEKSKISVNPDTGDILYIIIPTLVIALLVIGFSFVYSKKKNLKNK